MLSIAITVSTIFFLINLLAFVNSYQGDEYSYENLLTRDTAGPFMVVAIVVISVLIRKLCRQ